MKLEEVTASVTEQLDTQAKLGVNVVDHHDVPEQGPVNGGEWWRIREVTAVFADLKHSTSISVNGSRNDAAFAYTYFIRAMTVILERFGTRYVDIQGDGIFGLFSGKDSVFLAAASAITMSTHMERVVEPKFRKDASTNQSLKVGIGVDRGTLLVRRLGLRGTRQNEVWAGRAVNVAAKLTSVAGNNQVVISDRVFDAYNKASKIRRRALLWTCGCSVGKPKGGLDIPQGETPYLWSEVPVPKKLGLDFQTAYRRKTMWCGRHGAEFCQAVVTGKSKAG